MKEGFDVGLEMSGNPEALPRHARQHVPRRQDRHARHPHRRGGRSTGPPSSSTCSRIKGIYGREMYETWYKMTVMIQTGLDITPVITHRFHYTEFEKGFEVMRSGESGKVVLDWSEGRVGTSVYGATAAEASCASELEQIRASARLFKGERVLELAAAGARRACEADGSAAEPLREQLPRAGQPSGRSSQAAREALDRWGYGMACVRFICGTQELHKQLEQRLSRVPRHRGHDPLLLLLRRQRRAVRDAARRRGRGHLRRAEPRLHHRRHPARARPSGSATATTTWPTWRRGSRRRAGALPA